MCACRHVDRFSFANRSLPGQARGGDGHGVAGEIVHDRGVCKERTSECGSGQHRVAVINIVFGDAIEYPVELFELVRFQGPIHDSQEFAVGGVQLGLHHQLGIGRIDQTEVGASASIGGGAVGELDQSALPPGPDRFLARQRGDVLAECGALRQTEGIVLTK